MKTSKQLFFISFSIISFNILLAQQWGDYTLYSVQNTKNAYLLDTNGTVFHTWTFSSGNTGYSTYMLPGGYLYRTIAASNTSFMGGGITGEIQKTDYAGNILWDYVYSTASYCMHHDVCPMPNGNVLIISYELKTAAELTQAGGSTSHSIWPDKIIEVQPTGTTGGTIVWEWHVWDHLVQNVDATKDNYQISISSHLELLNINYQNTSNTTDWMHCNGIDYNPVTDQIVFSSHHMNEMYVIDHSTTSAEAATHIGGNSGKGGDFLYRWGNPASYGGTGTADFNVVHDAHWIKQGLPRAGSLVGFNNNGISNSQSSVDIIEPSPFTANMNYSVTAGSPTTYSKRYALNGHASDMGNSQKLPNGNMLFCIATSGSIYETDSTGTTLWSKTVSGTAPKAFRYAACYLSDTLFNTPTITASDSLLTSSPANSYQWFYNGNPITGATSQSYIAVQYGFYTVQTSSANNCVLKYAPLYNYINPNTTGIIKINKKNDLIVFPNPTTGLVSMTGLAPDYSFSIYDSYGHILLQGKETSSVNLSDFANGVYYMMIKSNDDLLTKKITVIK